MFIPFIYKEMKKPKRKYVKVCNLEIIGHLEMDYFYFYFYDASL